MQETPSGKLGPFTEAVIAGIEQGQHDRDIAVGLRLLVRPRHLMDACRETYGDIRSGAAAFTFECPHGVVGEIAAHRRHKGGRSPLPRKAIGELQKGQDATGCQPDPQFLPFISSPSF